MTIPIATVFGAGAEGLGTVSKIETVAHPSVAAICGKFLNRRRSSRPLVMEVSTWRHHARSSLQNR